FQPWASAWSAPEERTVPGVGPAIPGAFPTAGQPAERRRGRGVGSAIGAAALTAVLVGGAAGYGGFRLAERDTSAASAPVGTPYLAPRPTRVAPLPSAPTAANTVEIAKRVLPGTVMISVGTGTGSGFVVDDQGHIVSNNHVVAGAADGSRIRVTFADGRKQDATLVGRSPSYDLAVIKVRASAQLQPLTLGDSDTSQIGQPVIAVGSPLGLPGTVTQGIVSARNRPVVVNSGANADAPTAYINAIQTDAPINPGNSGGPLIDAGARVIGVNSAILTLGGTQTTQSGNIGLGFAIPVNQVSVIAAELISRGKATYPVIGATVSENSAGVRLATVEAGGPADRAGLRAGDVVTAIDGAPVDTAEELIVAIRTRRPGGTVTLDYSRGSNDQQARVTLGSKEG
ncbi:MAG: putative family peptidase, partial [Friedmanniella sp.]|nr:putative family peptidase [Friedmanniella sp.]